MDKIISINGVEVARGESKNINIQIAKLPTHTVIDLPIYVSRGEEDGPVLLLSGGLHGDEINGVEIVRRMVANDLYKPKRGIVICIPIINIYGFLHFSRDVPDGKDVNRSFPGSRNGSLASQVAYNFTNQIIPLIDYGIDFHTGGARINNFPQVRAILEDEINLELAAAFAAPFLINSGFVDKSMRQQASIKGVRVLVYEAGESLRLRKQSVDFGVEGALRVMKHLKMIDSAPVNKSPSIRLNKTKWIRADSSGLYHTHSKNGSAIKKGDVLGLITDPFGEYESEIISDWDGYIYAINNNPVINKGDALIHIGKE